MRIQIEPIILAALVAVAAGDVAFAQTSGRGNGARSGNPGNVGVMAARRLPSRRGGLPGAPKGRAANPEQIATSVRALPRELNPAAENTSLDIPAPDPNDPARERILQLQEQLTGLVEGPILSGVRVGMRVIDAATGRTFFRHGGTLMMDPASNQKVLATTTAIMRLGAGFRFRTELLGPPPDGNGVVKGDIVVRGMGDPSLRMVDLETLAADLAARGVVKVEGAITGDPRRIGSQETHPDERTPLRVARAYMTIKVRPSLDGLPPIVTVTPNPEVVSVRNRAITASRGRGLKLNLSATADHLIVELAGRIPPHHPGLIMRRVAPDQRIFTAALVRRVLIDAGIEVRDNSRVYDPSAPAEKGRESTILAVHRSDPLSVLVRRINKESDNEWADRLLDVVGAELFGGPATPDKGLRALREAMDELGLARESYLPANASGLGHANRITADALAELLHKIYLDPRWGPEMMQSLSVGGVDGTTRNRFRGSPAAERVRVKTGTLSGKSCLSGYVGDGHEVLVFSIFVDGIRDRRYTTIAVRNAQVSAVNAMMRFARGVAGETPDDVEPGIDFELGEEIVEADVEEGKPGADAVTVTDAPATTAAAPPPAAGKAARHERDSNPRVEERSASPGRGRGSAPIEPEVQFSDEEVSADPPRRPARRRGGSNL